MSKEKLKKELHELIDNMEDMEMLGMVKEDIVAYQKAETRVDDLSDLTSEERAELEESINEDPEKDIISHEEFKKNIEEWRSALLQKRDLKTK
jgi:hypothetical protein